MAIQLNEMGREPCTHLHDLPNSSDQSANRTPESSEVPTTARAHGCRKKAQKKPTRRPEFLPFTPCDARSLCDPWFCLCACQLEPRAGSFGTSEHGTPRLTKPKNKHGLFWGTLHKNRGTFPFMTGREASHGPNLGSKHLIFSVCSTFSRPFSWRRPRIWGVLLFGYPSCFFRDSDYRFNQTRVHCLLV